MSPEITNAENLQFSVDSVKWIVLAVIGVYSWWIGKQSATNLEVASLRERIIEVETKLKNMPSQEAIAEVNRRLERVDANTEATKEALDTLQITVNRINDYLLNNK